MQGQVEVEVLKVAESHPQNFDSYVLRPAFVIPKQPNILQRAFLNSTQDMAIDINILAENMVNLALADQSVEPKIWTNKKMILRSQELAKDSQKRDLSASQLS